MGRLRELDFLRGIAILLVLLRHMPFSSFTGNMGWAGVDLFFVLSGFLVSGLLFKEYIRFGNIRPKLFLIRRGFKIYPIYFLFYLPYLFQIIRLHKFKLLGFAADMTFTQNYVWGWGYAYAASWSLAVEEHFYFGFVLFLYLFLKYGRLTLPKPNTIIPKQQSFPYLVVGVLIACLALRLVSNMILPNLLSRNFSMTHLRIDSLLFGTLISYFFYFKNEWLSWFFFKHKHVLYTIAFLGICWLPFIDPVRSFFVKTIGFTLAYLSFGIVLTAFLLEKNINATLNRLFTPLVVNHVSKIGFCSYSIYIIHSFIISTLNSLFPRFNYDTNPYLFFIAASSLSVLIGMLMTHKVEKYFLAIRNKHYPSRV